MRLMAGKRCLLHVRSALAQRSTGIVLYQYSLDGERYQYADRRGIDNRMDALKRKHPNHFTTGELPCSSTV